jgi:hypothetical protein
VPVSNIPVGRAEAHPTGPLILRVAGRDDVPLAAAVAPERVVWVEIPLDLAHEPWPAGMPLDIIVAEPHTEAPGLHALSRVRHDHPLRVTIPVVGGVARAGRVAMSLQLPVRLLPSQPSPQAVAELGQVLDIYLHDPQTVAPVQFFHSALAHWLHGEPTTLWQSLEQDPAYYPRFGPGPEDPAPNGTPRDPAFAVSRLARLVEEGGECASCRFRDVCGGYFKWPDASYACAPVLPLLARLEEAAADVARDLSEADATEP